MKRMCVSWSSGLVILGNSLTLHFGILQIGTSSFSSKFPIFLQLFKDSRASSLRILPMTTGLTLSKHWQDQIISQMLPLCIEQNPNSFTSTQGPAQLSLLRILKCPKHQSIKVAHQSWIHCSFHFSIFTPSTSSCLASLNDLHMPFSPESLVYSLSPE